MLLLAAVWLADKLFPLPFGRLVAFLACLPVAGWLALKVDDWWDARFIRALKRRLQARLGSAPGGTFVGLLPGGRVMPVGSVFVWDIGMLYLEPERLTYRGEQAQFSVPKSEC